MVSKRDVLDTYSISYDESILSALDKMDKSGLRNLVVIQNNKVKGTLTDGDVRRALLKGLALDDKVSKAMKSPCFTLFEGESSQSIVNMFQNEAINIVPIIGNQGELSNIITRKMFEKMLLSIQPISTSHTPVDDYISEDYRIASKPWGYYRTTILNELFQSKILYVLPGQALSLQSHKQREEHWTIISGTGSVQLDDSKKIVKPGDCIYIPKGCKHRIKNASNEEMLIFSEIQLGTYFGEDDIIRYDDMYGR